VCERQQVKLGIGKDLVGEGWFAHSAPIVFLLAGLDDVACVAVPLTRS